MVVTVNLSAYTCRDAAKRSGFVKKRNVTIRMLPAKKKKKNKISGCMVKL